MEKMKPIKAYTDAPIEGLDRGGEKAPIREVKVLSYDRNKYCVIEFLDERNRIIRTEIKSGYIYKKYGRFGEVDSYSYSYLRKLPKTKW